MSGALYCRVPSDWLADSSLCWFEWQALIGSALAVAAGAGTIFFLRRQLIQSERHENGRRERQLAAVRSTLPLALSGLIQFPEQAIKQLKHMREIMKNDLEGAVADLNPPKAPDQHINNLKDLIENCNNNKVNDLICEIIREIQILVSRVKSLKAPKSERNLNLNCEVDEYIIQSARLNVLIGLLFPYARNETNDIQVVEGWDSVENHLFLTAYMKKIFRGFFKS